MIKQQNKITSSKGDFVSHYLTNYEPISLLGEGGFGVVIKSKNILDESSYAIKIVELPNQRDEKEKVLREVKTMAKLDHKNIVSYLGTWYECPPSKGWLDGLINKYKFETSSNSYSSYNDSNDNEEEPSEMFICIKMELCNKDSLKEWLWNKKENRDKERCLDIIRDLLNGIKYIHRTKKLMHRYILQD